MAEGIFRQPVCNFLLQASSKCERMRQVARQLLTLIAAFSLLLSLIAGVMWIRSYDVAERITWRRTDGDRSVATDHGRLRLSWDLGFVSQTNRPRGLEYERPHSAFALLDPILFMCSDTGEIYQYWERAGFSWIKKDRPRSGTYMARAVAAALEHHCARRAPAAGLDDRSTPLPHASAAPRRPKPLPQLRL